jgi:hypothetical protein
MSEKPDKRPIQIIPTRTLLASIKKDIRKQLKAAKATGKSKKQKIVNSLTTLLCDRI